MHLYPSYFGVEISVVSIQVGITTPLLGGITNSNLEVNVDNINVSKMTIYLSGSSMRARLGA